MADTVLSETAAGGRGRLASRRVVPAELPVRLISAGTLVSLLVLWATAAQLQWISPVFLLGPAAVWEKFLAVTREGFVDATLLQHVTASLGRVFAALSAALLIGVPVGLAIGVSQVGRGILDQLVELLRPIP